jgi:HPr kinase/phosphorylase
MGLFKDIQQLSNSFILVESLLKSPVKFEALTGTAGLQKKITNKNLHRPQLALTGYVELFNYFPCQIFGNTEIFYLNSLKKKDRFDSFSFLLNFDLPCIILTNSHILDPELIELAKERNIAVLTTPYDTTKTTFLLTEFLDDQFAVQAVVHGSFVDVYGVGILFAGKSGIGKSEIALDLVERGHRLVADDVVMLTKKRESIIMGTGTNLVQHFMEIRGLGIIDIRQMFGIRSIRFQKRLEIVVELEEYIKEKEYTRIGLDEEPLNLLGVDISTVKLPIFPGKNITVIAEVIATNYLLRTYGYNAAKIFTDRLQEEIGKKKGNKNPFFDNRNITFFQSDDE